MTAVDRPLLIVDVDEVVLAFVGPFGRFLEERGARLLPRSYALTGNIVAAGSTQALPAEAVDRLLAAFFATRVADQPAVDGAVEALHRLAAVAEIVFLSNLPAAQAEARRTRLAELGLIHPLLVNAGPKGPAASRLAAERTCVVFIDDGPTNLASVRDHVAGCRLVHFVDDPAFFDLAPPVTGTWLRSRDWREVARRIDALLHTPPKDVRSVSEVW